MKRVLLTGYAGFLGSHIAEHLLEHTDWQLVGLVTFRHRGDQLRMESAYDPKRVQLEYCDLSGPLGRLADKIGEVDYVINCAAESHVERSIEDPVTFGLNNVQVAYTMLEYARRMKPEVFIQISTDEVYGPAKQGEFHKEWSPIVPSNPYSASKAMQEAIAIAYWRTYRVPVVITNTMNLIGERQDEEKFVPLVIRQVAAGQEVQIHGSPEGQSGSRCWLHARNMADALLFLLDHLIPARYPQAARPSRFNVVGEERSNLEMAQLIAKELDRTLVHRVVDAHSSRPGHDLRYALDGTKLANLGWRAPLSLDQSIRKMVAWMLEHPAWLKLPSQVK